MNVSRAVLMIALCSPLIAFSGEMTESPTSLTSISKSMPALAGAVSAGVDKACVPTHLTLTGPAAKGDRLYVSALVSEFTTELRKSAKGNAKLSRVQAHEVQTLLNYAMQAQKDATGFPPEALRNFESRTGLSIQADLVCMTRESITGK